MRLTLGRSSGLAVSLVLAALPALAQNFPPIARLSVSSPLPSAPGAAVQFVGSASSDPDAGPSPLSHDWRFGDGQSSTAADPTHVFAARGLYLVSLTVSDGQDSSVATQQVPVLEPAAALRPRSSSTLALAPDGTLWVANEDSATVTPLDTSTLSAGAEIPVGSEPVSLALSSDGLRLFVACRGDGTVRVIDTLARSEVARAPIGREPASIVMLPGDTGLLVALEGEAALRWIDPSDPLRQRLIPIGGRPHAIAVTGDGSRAVISDFLASATSGRAFILDLVSEMVTAEVELPIDLSPDTTSSGRGVPNLLSCIAIEPSGLHAHVGGLKSNVLRGLTRDGRPLVPTNRVRGLVAALELATGLERSDWRIDTNDADSASALAFSTDGSLLYVAHRGSGELSVYDVLAAADTDTSDGSAVPFVSRIAVGDAPDAIVIDGARAFVSCALSRSVVVLDLADPRRPRISASIPVTVEPLPPPLLLGKLMFTRSSRPMHSSEGYVACASCHPRGGHDGMTWDFTDGGEGLRNTIDLRGKGGMAHGPLHWSANFDEVQDFENDIVRAFGGTGLAGDGQGPNAPMGASNAGRSAELDGLAAYVASFLSSGSSPYRAGDGSLSAAALRGKSTFFRPDVGCAGCHVPPLFTDSTAMPDAAAYRLHDVGTLLATSGTRLGAALRGLDTPTLKGLWDGAPYLHDGRAVNLREVLVDFNTGDRHGRTSQLGVGVIDDLVAWLLSIDEAADVLPDAPTMLPAEVAPPGEAALMARRSGAWLLLEWPLVAQAETYVVSRGELASFASHRVEVGGGSCDTGGEPAFYDPDDLADGINHYYLVAARNRWGEGSLGVRRPDPFAPLGSGPLRPSRLPTVECP